jgi:hypothetical protein
MSAGNSLYPSAVTPPPTEPLLPSAPPVELPVAGEEPVVVPPKAEQKKPSRREKLKNWFRKTFRRKPKEPTEPVAANRFDLLPSIDAALRRHAPTEVLRTRFGLSSFQAIEAAHRAGDLVGVTSFYNAGYSLAEMYDLMPYTRQMFEMGLSAAHFRAHWSFSEFCQRWSISASDASEAMSLSHAQLLSMEVSSLACYARSPEPLTFATVYALKLSPQQVANGFERAAEWLAQQEFSEHQKYLLLRLGWDAEAVERWFGVKSFQKLTLSAGFFFASN